MKTILKEIIIVLLLVLAILLVLGVFLYDYIPMNKVVPKIEQYEAPNDIKKELEESVTDTENTMSPIIYEINNSDLNLYKKSKDYDAGKVNPFSDTSSTNTVNTNTVDTGSNNTGTNTQTNTSTTSNSSSEGSFLPSTGTK